MVYELFPPSSGSSRDFLYADLGGDFSGRKILIVSKREPQTPKHGRVASKEIPESFLGYDYYAFEVRLNPTKRDNSSRKLVSMRTHSELLEWFHEKCSHAGFVVIQDSLQVKNIGVQQFEKKGEKVVQGEATFVGKGKVTDRVLFTKSFEEGMGRGKAFGFGLLRIVPIQI